MLTALREVWEQFPDQRLCQIVTNVAGQSDPFYVEDDAFSKRLAHYPSDPPS